MDGDREPERDLYNIGIEEGPSGEGGIFDFADERNPFADYSIVYVALPYVAPGDEHVVLSGGLFYTETVNGEKLVDWVTRLIGGNRSTMSTARKAASAERRQPMAGDGCRSEVPAALPRRPENRYGSLTLSRAWRAGRAGCGWGGAHASLDRRRD